MLACRLQVLVLLSWLALHPFFMGSRSGGNLAAARSVDLQAPRTVLLDKPLDLHCNFDTRSSLYTVKWYKDGKEFFRVAPRARRTKRVFLVQGVHVDEKSNASHVRLLSVSRDTSGQFSCEVTEEAPSFFIMLDLKSVQVVELEEDAGAPQVTEMKTRYRENEEIQTSCTGPWSRPAADLKWIVNEQIADERSIHAQTPKENVDGLRQAALHLSTHAHAGADGFVRLRCIADLGDVYFMTTEFAAQVVGKSRSTTSRVNKEDAVLPNIKTSSVDSSAQPSGHVSSHAKSLIIFLLILLFLHS